jgi:hypothetical protein
MIRPKMAVKEAVNPQHIVDTIMNNHTILWLSSYVFFIYSPVGCNYFLPIIFLNLK